MFIPDSRVSYLGWFSSKFLVFFWFIEVIYKFFHFNFCFLQSSNISKLNTFNLDTVQDFLSELGMKPHMYLAKIIIFSWYHQTYQNQGYSLDQNY